MSSPLKIAVVVKSFTVAGGMEKYAVELATRLRNRGHSIDVYTREADEKYCQGIGVKLLPHRFSSSSVLSAMALASDYEKALQGKKYDVIHSHERGYSQDVLTNHCFTYKGSICSSSLLKRLDYMLFSPRSWMYLYLESKQMKSSSLVGVSGAIKNDIYDHYQRCDVKVITPGVDCNKFHPEKLLQMREMMRSSLGIKEGEKVVLFVGSEFTRKGLDYLLPIVKVDGMRLVVVGRGDNTGQYKQKVSSMGIEDKVVFTGLVDDVERYYGAADLVVLPSKSEAFGMSILEAMASGLPVLVSDNSGVAGLIKNGENGFILADKNKIVREVARIVNTDTCHIRQSARRTAEQFSWDSIADQYEALFYEVKQQKKRAVQ